MYIKIDSARRGWLGGGVVAWGVLGVGVIYGEYVGIYLCGCR